MNSSTRRELIALFIQLEQCEKAGVPIFDSIRMAVEEAGSRSLKRRIKIILGMMEDGHLLSEGMMTAPLLFDEMIVRFVEIGEETGHMGAMFERCAEYLRRLEEHARQMRRATRNAKFTFGIMAFLAAVFHHDNTLVLNAIYLAVLISSVLTLRRLSRIFRYATDMLILRLPWIGPLVRQYSYARFAEGLSILYSSGVDLKKSLHSAVLCIPNLRLRDKVEDVLPLIDGGLSLFRAFSQARIFDARGLAMLRAGETSGNLSAALREWAEYHDTRIEEEITAVQQFAGPLCSLLLGGLLFRF